MVPVSVSAVRSLYRTPHRQSNVPFTLSLTKVLGSSHPGFTIVRLVVQQSRNKERLHAAKHAAKERIFCCVKGAMCTQKAQRTHS